MSNRFLVSFGRHLGSMAHIRGDTDGTTQKGECSCSDAAVKLRAASGHSLYEGDDGQVTVCRFACESREVVAAKGSMRRCAGSYFL